MFFVTSEELNIVGAVRNGDVDVGFVSASVLERMVQLGAVYRGKRDSPTIVMKWKLHRLGCTIPWH